MNSIRSFLLFAWLMVAAILWMQWNKEQQPAPPAPVAATTAGTPADGLPPPALPDAVPTAGAAAPAMTATPSPVAKAPTVTLSNDVLRLVLDGGHVRRADLLGYRTGSLNETLQDTVETAEKP